MKTEKDIFRDYLNKRGLKFTHERELILKEVFARHEHFDVEALFQRLYQKDKRISRATIYRALPLLIDSGLISEAMRCKDRIYYEHIYGHKHHSHMLCIKCGKIIEFSDDKIEKLKGEICKKYGFKPVEYRFGIKGYCKDCQ